MTDELYDPESLAREVRSLLSDLGAESRDLEPLPHEAARAEHDLARILSTARDEHPAARPTSRPTRRRIGRAVVLLAAAAVLAVGLVTVRPFTGPDTAMARTPPILQIQDGGGAILERPTTPASGELRRLAGLAADGEEPTDGPVQLIVRSSWLLSTDEAAGDTAAKSVLVPVHSEQYFQPDGTVRSIERRGDPLDSEGHLTDVTGSWSDVEPRSDETFEGPEGGPDYPSTLSNDADELASQLVPDPAECVGSATRCVVAAMTFLHYSYTIGPQLNAALLTVLSQQQDIRFAGLSTDRLGRSANAFVTPGTDLSRTILLFAPEDGTFLGSEEILVKDSPDLGLEAPAVIEFTALEDSGRVSTASVPDASLTTRY